MVDQEKIEIDLVSPEKQVFSKMADMVIISGVLLKESARGLNSNFS